MIYLLLIFLILSTLIGYLLSNKDLLSPWVISNSIFAFSTVVALVNRDYWDFDLSPTTCRVIVMAMICLGLGEMLIRYFFSKRYITTNSQKKIKMESVDLKKYFEMHIPVLHTIFISVAMALYVFLYYIKLGQIASIVGNVEDFASKLEYFNLASAGGYSVGIIFTLLFIVFTVLIHFYLYTVLYKVIFSKFRKRDGWNLLPITIYCILQVISSSRSNFIYIISAAIVIGYILWRNKYDWKRKSNKKMIKIGIMSIIVFFIIFYFLGNLTGKSERFANAFEGISVYTGGSIASFNLFLEDYTYNQSDFGSETLYGIHRLFSRLGNETMTETRHLEFTSISPSIRTNVYTSLRRYLHDYGSIGMYLIQFLIGVLYTTIYLRIKHHDYKNEILAILIYSSIFYPLVMQSIDEKFLTIMITPTILIQIFCFIIFYKMFVKKPIKIKT